MAFDLTEKLQNVFKNLRSKGRLTEEDVKAVLKEVKMALLEADVNFKVVKNFVKKVQERAVGQDVLNSLTPGQMVVKLVNEELVALMGSETTEIALRPSNEITVLLMCGLQGAGKTTTTAKIAGKLKKKGRKPLLVACDVYRPAAIDQLKINGEKQLKAHGASLTNIEVTEANIGAFKPCAKKYGVDFTLRKDKTTQPPHYIVIFKAKDADNLEQAFREFTAKTLTKEQRPSIRKVLAAAKQKAAQQPKRAKEKIKQRGLER